MFESESRIQFLASELSEDGIDAANRESIAYPIILWWTPFTREHQIKTCGNVKCFFTNDRHYKQHKNLQVRNIVDKEVEKIIKLRSVAIN